MDEESGKDSETERLAADLVDAALKVHRNLGPGLLETVYEVCLCHKLCLREIPFKRQVSVPIIYEGVTPDAGLRLDIVVADRIVVESGRKAHPTIRRTSSHVSEADEDGTRSPDQLQLSLIKNGIRRIIL